MHVSRGSSHEELYTRSGKGLLQKWTFRPFLTQSDSASRNLPFSTGIFFHWILLVLLIVSRVDFIVFVLFFLEAIGVKEYYCMALETRLAALVLRAFLASNACFTRDQPLSKRVGGVGLSRKPQSYVRGVALSREPPKQQ